MASKQPGRPLTASYCRTVTRPGRHGDGYGSRGLSLKVRRLKNGRTSKRWQQQLKMADGRWTTLTIGRYPEIGLAEARRRAIAHSREVAYGRDPRKPGLPTFAEAAETHIDRLSDGWTNPRTSASWRSTLAAYAYPVVGSVRVDLVTSGHVLRCLEDVWTRTPATGRKVLRRVSAVLDAAVAEGHRPDNPAISVIRLLPVHNGRTTHRKAVAVKDAPAAYRKLAEASKVSRPVRSAAMLVALTATRSAETREAEWTEIDLTTATWTIPASRTKTKTEHRVPLSGPALAVLDTMTAESRYVFTGPTGRPVSGEAVRRVTKSAIGATVHGWRSTMRSWCAEAGVDPAVAESALGHVNGDKVEAAYQRSDLFERRRDVMAAWAEYIAE